MTSSLQTANDRVQRDLVDSERSQREAAERLARDLAKVLQELAIFYDGSRLEALRHEDPKIPQYWTPDDWRSFFANVPAPAKAGWAGANQQSRVVELERMNAELKKRLAEMETRPTRSVAAETASDERVTTNLTLPKVAREVVPEKAPRLAIVPKLYDLPAEVTPPLAGLLARARDVWNTLPNTCPVAFQKLLSGGGRKGEDLKKAYQRCWLMLYLIGACRINAKFEIEDILAFVCGLSTKPGSLGRISTDLMDAGILTGEVIRIGSPKTSLRLLQISPEGKKLYKVLFERDPEETEWERIIRLHEGERFPEHTLALLIFTLHARKRGWATQILPPVSGTKAVPDLLVMRGEEKLYVEVELGQKESPTKWRNQAALNGNLVALCAATPETRQRLAGDCRLAKLPGMATDLETLVKFKSQDITEETPLWLEKW